MKKKLSKGLILSAVGVGLLLLQMAGVGVDAPHINKVAEAVCALLIVLGVITATVGSKDESTEDGSTEESTEDAFRDESTESAFNEGSAEGESAGEFKEGEYTGESVGESKEGSKTGLGCSGCLHDGNCKTGFGCSGCLHGEENNKQDYSK